MTATLKNLVCVGLLATALSMVHSQAQVPGLLSYQGRVLVNGTAFAGVGQFKFALVNPGATQVYWLNSADNNGDGEPDASLPVTVNAGLFTIILGDTTLPAMAALPISVFTNPAVYLRVWFNDGAHGVQLLSPDERVASTAYAMMAGNIADGTITPAKLAPNTASAINSALSLQVTTLTAQLNTLAGQVATLSNQLSSTAPAGLTAASVSAQDAALMASGFQAFSVVPAPAWQTSLAPAAPSARFAHAAAWTGQQLLIWGGTLGASGDSGAGASYRPDLDEWQPISPVSAPSARSHCSAVWSGTEMIVWGGTASGVFQNTGARFNPTNQTWRPVTTTNAPDPRLGHIAVWTGKVMALWGGRNNSGALGTGGLYAPASDSWTALSVVNAPAPRSDATAVWTGSRLIIWGGQNEQGGLNTGAQIVIFNGFPTAWTPTSVSNAPVARTGHTAVWTGQQMLVWGGQSGNTLLADGAGYDPVANLWSPITTSNAPTARAGHGAVWTGQEMIIFGGETAAGTVGDGAAYSPATGLWRPLGGQGNPLPRSSATTLWSGSQLIVFGGLSNGQPLAALQSLNPQPAWYLYRKP